MGVDGAPVHNKPKYEMFAKIKLKIGEVSLIDSLWDILPLYQWLVTNKERLLSEKFPFEILPGESIVECRNRLYTNYDFENEQEEERYYTPLADYFNHHTLRILPDEAYCIGLRKDGVGEISGYYKKRGVEGGAKLMVFEFAMEQFVNDTFAEIDHYYELWRESFYAEEAYKKWEKIRNVSSL